MGGDGRGRGSGGGRACGCGGGSEETEDTGVAVVEGKHGVEEVGYHCCACSDSCCGIFIRGFCVADAENDVMGRRGQGWDEGGHVWEFRGGGYKTNIAEKIRGTIAVRERCEVIGSGRE